MSRLEFNGTADDLLYLLRCSLCGEVPDAERVSRIELDAVYRLAQLHLVTALCSLALESAGVVDQRFIQARGKALRKVAAMDAERERLCARLDAAGIWYLPLKGCVMQGMYPVYGTREVSDTDLLFDGARAVEVKAIMESLGFSTESFGQGPHDVYHKEPVCNYELHRELFADDSIPTFHAYYRGIRLLGAGVPGSSERRLSHEDFYVYLIAHSYKHYAHAGSGIRLLTDIFVCARSFEGEMDWAYVDTQLDQLGLQEFERQMRDLALALFDGDGLGTCDDEALAYILESGAYGTESHVLANQIKQYGRAGYLLNRAFPPRDALLALYPVLGRAPAMLPACWAHRLAKAVVVKPRTVVAQLCIAFK